MDQKPTRPEHPKLALARSAPKSRFIIAALVGVIAIGFLAFLKQESMREQTVLDAEMAADEIQRLKDAKQTSVTLTKAYKGKSRNTTQQELVARVGKALTERSDAKASSKRFAFHLLAEPNAINLFAFSNGDIYLTAALVNRMQTEGQLASALAHGMAHVLGSDAPESVPATPQSNNLPLWAYSADDEAKADVLALKLVSQAGYDPNAMIGMFSVLIDAYQAGADVAFFVTHPNSEDRLVRMRQSIGALYPEGIPSQLSK